MYKIPFKTQTRIPRIQAIEEKFNMGMKYTNNPLPEGHCKMLLNLDVAENGESLKPRYGLQTDTTLTDSAEVLTAFTTTGITGCALFKNETSDYKQLITYEKAIASLPDTQNADVSAMGHYLTTVRSVCAHDNLFNQVEYDTYGILNQELIGTLAFNNSFYFPALDYVTVNNVTTVTKKFKYTSFDSATETIVINDLTPYVPNPREATKWGFNMLSTNPFTFVNQYAALCITGIIPYEDASGTKLAFEGYTGEIHLQCFWNVPNTTKTYTVKWEMTQDLVSNTWTSLSTSEVTITQNALQAPPALKQILKTNTYDTVIVRVTITDKADPTVFDIMFNTFNLTKTQSASSNAEQTNYTLPLCKGMTYWQNRLIVWGVPEDPTILFTSDINNPSYFPYPQGIDVFDEPIVTVKAIQDNLIVFTTTKIYMVSLSADAIGLVRRQIQSNLFLKPEEVPFVQVIKNMVIFKSGKYFYMIVPKAQSLTGELTIAPISKNIESLLDNFEIEIDKMLKKVYTINKGLILQDNYTFFDYEDIYNVFRYQETGQTNYLNVCLLYNINTRIWKIYTFESENKVYPFFTSATAQGLFIVTKPGTDTAFRLLAFKQDAYEDQTVATKHYPNYQMVDTGQIDANSDLKKRYREVQLKINNLSAKELTFYNDFYVDGELRHTYEKSELKVVPDETNTGYSTLVLERTLEDINPRSISILPGDTYLNSWVLGSSTFPLDNVNKIRIPVSGKGYMPRLTFVSFNEKAFEILNISWVYRNLYSR